MHRSCFSWIAASGLALTLAACGDASVASSSHGGNAEGRSAVAAQVEEPAEPTTPAEPTPPEEPTTPEEPTAPAAPALPPVTNLDANGPFAVTVEQGAGPNRGWIARPTRLGENGLKHPVFSWGCGGGSQPSQYRDHLTRWASHGFVVEAHVSTGNARDHSVVLDWVTSENNRQGSVYYQKLDPSKIAAGGHSMGSVATFAVAADPRLSTTIHVAGGSFDGNGPRNLRKPTAYMAGANDALGATQNAERDYRNTTVPVFLTVMTGVDHILAAREAMAPITGWLRWHLGGETQRRSDFIGASCTFCTGKFRSQSKNWD